MKQLISIAFAFLFGIISNAQSTYKFPESIRPLIDTQWGQDYPFNLFCPATGNGNTSGRQLAGCGAIAMAQIVRYHEYPHISPDKRYEYEWNMMFNKASNAKNDDYREVVAKLISDCGISAFTDYGDKASSTSLTNIMTAMKRVFGYSKYMAYYSRDQFSTPMLDSIYRQLIFNELKAGRPVIYRGYSDKKQTGHLFIIDGCSGSKVHVNLGWAGKDNGYYELDDLASYYQKQSMLIAITDSSYIPSVRSVTLNEANTLHELISEYDFLRIQHLHLAGEMGETDFQFLRRMLNEGVLSSIDMSECNITRLPKSAFERCNNLTYIVLPHSLKYIDEAAFRGCQHLCFVDFNENLLSIDRDAFNRCTSLISLSLPPSLVQIYKNAFTSCATLFHVVLPDGVKGVGIQSFANCTNLRSISFPSSVHAIGAGILDGCQRLRRVNIDENNSYYQSVGTRIEFK